MRDIYFNMSDHIDRAKLMVSVQNEKFIDSCQRATIMKRYAFLSSRNSAHFDRRTISVGQVVAEIPLPPVSNFSADLHWSQPQLRVDPKFRKLWIRGIQRIRGKVWPLHTCTVILQRLRAKPLENDEGQPWYLGKDLASCQWPWPTMGVPSVWWCSRTGTNHKRPPSGRGLIVSQRLFTAWWEEEMDNVCQCMRGCFFRHAKLLRLHLAKSESETLCMALSRCTCTWHNRSEMNP